ncbi:MAG: alpha/beta fold hydrolase [Ktedonobacteraceae bacterium]|nr:alpha/beta fold hydrolase [Ktedonobacteraceae bacterium]
MDPSCGCRLIEINDAVQRAMIPLVLLYPAREPERTERFGPYTLDVARDAPPIGQHLPLVIISHGNAGTPWAYRDLATHLVRAGFLVALPEHRGNSRNDNSLAGTAANLENRPRHISLTIDAVFVDPVIKNHLASTGVGVIGHSIGGYTALAVAGGQPWSGPHENLDGKPHPVRVTPDKRVCSLILLNPATFWFIPESLKDVRVPILMRTGERDEITPASHADTVIRGVFDPSLVDHKVIPGAGHFSVMSKFPPEMIRSDFPPSQDPEGFNREEIQPSLYADIVDFLKRTL